MTLAVFIDCAEKRRSTHGGRALRPRLVGIYVISHAPTQTRAAVASDDIVIYMMKVLTTDKLHGVWWHSDESVDKRTT